MKTFEKLAAAAWALMAALSAANAAGLLPASLISETPACLFHFLTGWDCPGCGMTRALIAVFQGRLADAWTLHPLSLPLISVWTAWLAWGFANRYRGSAFEKGWPDLLAGARGWAVLVVVLAVWAVRL